MSARKTVMVCDDEADLVYHFRSALEPAYTFLAVESGKSCIEKFIELKQTGENVDVLLLDYRLGDMQGNVVVCKIHELHGVKTFLISAYELEQTLINNLIESRYIIGVMRKPIRISAMIEELEEVLAVR